MALLWHPKTGRVLVAVNDTRNSKSFEFEVEPPRALEAFRHPYAFVASGKVSRELAA